MEISKPKMIIFLLIILFVAGVSYTIITDGEEYTIILDGEQLEEIMECDNFWNYGNISLIPCIDQYNKIDAVPHPYINKSLSPQENCNIYNMSFIGFNVKNQTLAEDRYKETSPKCSIVKRSEIDEEFLKSFECTAEPENCKEWRKGDLIIREKGWNNNALIHFTYIKRR